MSKYPLFNYKTPVLEIKNAFLNDGKYNAKKGFWVNDQEKPLIKEMLSCSQLETIITETREASDCSESSFQQLTGTFHTRTRESSDCTEGSE